MTTTTAPTAAGRHRWDKGGPIDHLGRRTITNPAGPNYWPDGVPAQRTTDTAVLNTGGNIRQAATEATPTSRVEILAELRDDLDAAAKSNTAAIFTEVVGGDEQDGGEQ
ncbi:hypothetical protein [Verrucosispora sp. NA02020]|uniref:hypothetical protein n=1 Tax=Verrucosispora sp. NA02020 TaxID=2742132 RepID=UPI003D75D5A9